MPASRNVQIAGVASICWEIWKLPNRACFEGRLIRSPIELIIYSCVFMKYWAGLHDSNDREALRAGADMLLNLAGFKIVVQIRHQNTHITVPKYSPQPNKPGYSEFKHVSPKMQTVSSIMNSWSSTIQSCMKQNPSLLTGFLTLQVRNIKTRSDMW